MIGRGQVGGGLAARWERAGHRVTRLGRDGGDAAGADAVLIAVPSSRISEALYRITGGPVAKTFNLQYAALYDRLDEQRVRPSNLYATDPGAREVTERLTRDAGYDPVHHGDLAYARMLEDATGIFRAIRLQGLGLYFHRYARPGDL